MVEVEVTVKEARDTMQAKGNTTKHHKLILNQESEGESDEDSEHEDPLISIPNKHIHIFIYLSASIYSSFKPTDE